MPTSNSTFNAQTTGDEIVAAYPEQVKDKIILITGANPGGIGLSTAVSLAKASPKLLIIAGRSSEKLEETAQAIKDVANGAVAVKHLHLDLSSQKSCREAAKQVLEDAEIPHLDLLINNAGVMNIAERTLSPEGIEMQFATNHIGHFLFTNLILPKLIVASATAASKQSGSAQPTRILNLSSRAVLYGPVRFSDWNFTKREAEMPESERMTEHARQQWDKYEDVPYVPQAAYGQSKTANVLFSLALNERLHAKHGILSIAVHPGGIRTNLSRHLTAEEMQAAVAKFLKTNTTFHMKNLDEGCSTTLTAALDPQLEPADLFVADCQVVDWAPSYATDPEKAELLWQLSEELVGEKF